MYSALVTGSSGYIGSHLVKELKDFKVTELHHKDKIIPHDYDYIFHCAGLNNRVDLTFRELYEANVELTIDILINFKPKEKFIFVATSDDQFKNNYAFTKNWAEQFVLFYGGENNISVLSVRLPKVTDKNIDKIVKDLIELAKTDIKNQIIQLI